MKTLKSLLFAREETTREGYEPPAPTDIGPAEAHTHGPSTVHPDNPGGAHQGFTDNK